MSVILTANLNPSQKSQIHSIVTASKESEPISASFPYEEADFYTLYESDGTICAAAAWIKEDEESFECCAFTDPKCRRNGMFSELLDAAIEELPEDAAILFYTDGKCGDTNGVLEALEAELVQEEHMMEIDLNKLELSITSCGGEQSCTCNSGELSAASSASLTMTELDLDGTRTLQYENPYGIVYISVFSSYYYLYGFEIKETFRSQGHGKRFLLQVLADLAKRNPLPLRLQVSEENVPALTLYKKTGFRITETLFCYLY